MILLAKLCDALWLWYGIETRGHRPWEHSIRSADFLWGYEWLRDVECVWIMKSWGCRGRVGWGGLPTLSYWHSHIPAFMLIERKLLYQSPSNLNLLFLMCKDAFVAKKIASFCPKQQGQSPKQQGQ